MAGWMIAVGDATPHGGMDIANYHLAKYLADYGGVELVSHRVDPALAARPGVTVTPVARPFGRSILGEPLLRRKALRRSLSVLQAGDRVIVNGGNCPVPDVNWVHYVHAAFTPIHAGSRLYRSKSRYVHQKFVRQEREALQLARLVICNSRMTARQVSEYCQVPESKTVVVYYGCDPQSLSLITDTERQQMRAELGWQDRPVAVFVGALGDRRKGFDLLFQAWTELAKDASWDVDLAVIGRGVELAAWQQRTADAGLGERIHYLGFRNDVPRVLAACNVMIHPARYEAYGLGVHEAICRGLPAIVSAEAGVSEQLVGTLDDLLLPTPLDAATLTDRLKHWRSQQDSFRRRVEPLANCLRARTWDVMAREICEAARKVPPTEVARTPQGQRSSPRTTKTLEVSQ
ncbi:hypothetical protein BH11PLA2_BH11PLA2_26730 [soil metagenome]